MSEEYKIVLPKDEVLKGKLERKLEEYKGRLEKLDDGYKHPELIRRCNIDSEYKIAVLERLLADGEVNTHAVSLELHKKYGIIDIEAFNNAAGVIEDYCMTGGIKNTYGGTGLR